MVFTQLDKDFVIDTRLSSRTIAAAPEGAPSAGRLQEAHAVHGIDF
jgi:hypothetical protein